MATTFSFDAVELTAVIAEWEALHTDLLAQRTGFDELQRLTAQLPAEDIMTRTFINTASHAATAANGSSEDVLIFVDKFLRKLKEAKDNYASMDEGGANLISVVME